jgi:amino acid transporter
VAILLNCSLYALLHWLDFSSLILLSMWSSFIAYLVVDAALIVLRRKEPDLPRPFRVPFGAAGLVMVLVPTVAITTWAIWQSAVEYWNQGQFRVLWLGLAGFLSGPLIYGVRALVRRLRR